MVRRWLLLVVGAVVALTVPNKHAAMLVDRAKLLEERPVASGKAVLDTRERSEAQRKQAVEVLANKLPTSHHHVKARDLVSERQQATQRTNARQQSMMVQAPTNGPLPVKPPQLKTFYSDKEPRPSLNGALTGSLVVDQEEVTVGDKPFNNKLEIRYTIKAPDGPDTTSHEWKNMEERAQREEIERCESNPMGLSLELKDGFEKSYKFVSVTDCNKLSTAEVQEGLYDFGKKYSNTGIPTQCSLSDFGPQQLLRYEFTFESVEQACGESFKSLTEAEWIINEGALTPFDHFHRPEESTAVFYHTKPVEFTLPEPGQSISVDENMVINGVKYMFYITLEAAPAVELTPEQVSTNSEDEQEKLRRHVKLTTTTQVAHHKASNAMKAPGQQEKEIKKIKFTKGRDTCQATEQEVSKLTQTSTLKKITSNGIVQTSFLTDWDKDLPLSVPFKVVLGQYGCPDSEILNPKEILCAVAPASQTAPVELKDGDGDYAFTRWESMKLPSAGGSEEVSFRVEHPFDQKVKAKVVRPASDSDALKAQVSLTSGEEFTPSLDCSADPVTTSPLVPLSTVSQETGTDIPVTADHAMFKLIPTFNMPFKVSTRKDQGCRNGIPSQPMIALGKNEVVPTRHNVVVAKVVPPTEFWPELELPPRGQEASVEIDGPTGPLKITTINSDTVSLRVSFVPPRPFYPSVTCDWIRKNPDSVEEFQSELTVVDVNQQGVQTIGPLTSDNDIFAGGNTKFTPMIQVGSGASMQCGSGLNYAAIFLRTNAVRRSSVAPKVAGPTEEKLTFLVLVPKDVASKSEANDKGWTLTVDYVGDTKPLRMTATYTRGWFYTSSKCANIASQTVSPVDKYEAPLKGYTPKNLKHVNRIEITLNQKNLNVLCGDDIAFRNGATKSLQLKTGVGVVRK